MTRVVDEPVAGYAPADERAKLPLGGYTRLVIIYNALFGGLLLLAAAAGRLPRRIAIGDLLLLGVATHKLSRLVTKDFVLAPLRAPFTTYRGSAGAGEVNEEGRGSGLQLAIGQLLTCPWCFGQWVAAALGGAFLFAPRLTRTVAGLYAVISLADLLQLVYEKLKSWSGQTG
jgi:hypothetical protein